MRLVPASTFSVARLAGIFNTCYEDYFTPFALDETAFRSMAELYDDDLDASQVATVDGEPVGICKVARRGDHGWVGGLGVAVSHRRKGIGAVLMRAAIEALRERGVRDLWLEVLVQNEPAVRLYERLGFEHVRELEVWSLDGFAGERRELPPLTLDDALGREERPPWQRADATVAHLTGVEALGDERSALVYRVAGEVASPLQCDAPDADAARALVEALPPGTTGVRWLNGPAGHPLNEALAALGGTLAHRQHELRLAL